MTRHLETIVELQKALTRLREANERLHGIPEWMREIHEQHGGCKAEIEVLEAATTEAAKQRRLAEAAVEDSQEKLKKFQQQISLVRTQREYGALLQEIDAAKLAVKTAEEQAFAAMERQEETQRRLAERREVFTDLDARYTAELTKWEEEKPGVARLVEELQGRIEVLRERLPEGRLVQFDRIYERHKGDPLAAVRRTDRGGRGPQMWHCGACNYRVRPQAVVEIRNDGSLIQCESCKRILYFEEAPV